MRRYMMLIMCFMLIISCYGCGQSTIEINSEFTALVDNGDFYGARQYYNKHKRQLANDPENIVQEYTANTLLKYTEDRSNDTKEKLAFLYDLYPQFDSYTTFSELSESIDYYNRGMELYNNGDIDNAIQELIWMRSVDPKYEEVKEKVFKYLEDDYNNQISDIEKSFLNGSFSYSNMDLELEKAALEMKKSVSDSVETTENSSTLLYDEYSAQKFIYEQMIVEYKSQLLNGEITPQDTASNSEESLVNEYYTKDNLSDGFYRIEDEKFYPMKLEISEKVNYVGYKGNPDTYYIYTSDYSEELIPHFSKNQQFAYTGDISNGYDFSLYQLEYSGYTYDLLIKSSNNYADAWTENGKDFTNIKTINGIETDFYHFSKEMGYERIREEPTFYRTMHTLGDILFSDTINLETGLTIGYFGDDTDFIEETIYPTIWFATSNSTDNDPYSRDQFHTQLNCEQTMDGYFLYSFPDDIPTGLYTLGPSTRSGDTPPPLLIYVE